jgi:hypothetical protein
MGNRKIIICIVWNIVFWLVRHFGAFPGGPGRVVAASDPPRGMHRRSTSAPWIVASTKYNYKDEDFTLPQVQYRRSTPMNIATKASQPPMLGGTKRDSLHQLCFASILVVSLSKVFSHRANGTHIDVRIIQQWLRNIRDHGVVRRRTPHTPQTSPEEASSVGATIPANEDDDENAPRPVEDWEERCRSLVAENAALRDQLLQLPEEDSPSSSLAPSDGIPDVEEQFKMLQETVDYWKRVAQMNAQQTDSEVQAERRHGARQLEQLKADMVQLVEAERAALLKEFQSMVEQLRESLL